jgi:quinol-cytochrome oxidoreductase complex cytochrome b subunit
MVMERMMEKLPVRSNTIKWIAGSILTALMIALGMVGLLRLFNFSIDAAVPSICAVVGAGIYAAKTRK